MLSPRYEPSDTTPPNPVFRLLAPGFIGGLLAWYGLRRARPLVPVAAGGNSVWSWSSVVTLLNGFVRVGTSQVHLGAVSRTWQENSHNLMI